MRREHRVTLLIIPTEEPFKCWSYEDPKNMIWSQIQARISTITERGSPNPIHLAKVIPLSASGARLEYNLKTHNSVDIQLHIYRNREGIRDGCDQEGDLLISLALQDEIWGRAC